MKHIEKTLKRNENLWKKIFSCLIFPFLTIVFLRLVIFFVQRCSLLFIVFSMCFHCVFCFFSRDVHYFSLFFQCVHCFFQICSLPFIFSIFFFKYKVVHFYFFHVCSLLSLFVQCFFICSIECCSFCFFFSGVH
jgi:type II secretory pathway component PulF